MIHYTEIHELNIPELSVYTQLKESQLKHIYEPEDGLFISESPKVIRRALNAGYVPESILFDPSHLQEGDRDILELCKNIPVYAAGADILIRITGYYLTDGMLCAMKRKPLPCIQELCRNSRRIAFLEDIENPTNTGAIFRSAAAMNIDAVILSDGCSDPLYRRAARVSMGTVFQIPWTFCSKSDSGYVKQLHDLNFKTAAMALTEDSVSISDPRLKQEEKLAIFLGNEQKGLCPETLAESDYVVKIPMAEGIDSLNVAAASAVAFWEILKR